MRQLFCWVIASTVFLVGCGASADVAPDASNVNTTGAGAPGGLGPQGQGMAGMPGIASGPGGGPPGGGGRGGFGGDPRKGRPDRQPRPEMEP